MVHCVLALSLALGINFVSHIVTVMTA